MLDLLGGAGPTRSGCQNKPRRIFSVRPVMMLSSALMPLNSAMFWKVRAMPPWAASCGRILHARLALEGDAALLRMIEAVDDVQHRRLAGAVRADDGADLALADVEGDVAQRLHAAERQRDVLDREQHIVDRDVGSARGPHAAFSIGGRPAPVARSRIFTRALITPLRPSSKVTSVEISASFEPSYSALISGCVALGDEAAADFLRARELAVVGLEFLVQDQEALDLRARHHLVGGERAVRPRPTCFSIMS